MNLKTTEAPHASQEQRNEQRQEQRAAIERFNNAPETLAHLCRDTVGQSELYKRLNSDPSVSHDEAYARAAYELSQDRDADLTPFERSMIQLSSRLGSFIKAGMELDDLREGGRLSNFELTEMRQIKLTEIIPFNHELKEVIDKFPSLNARALAFNMTAAHTEIYSNYDPNHPERSRRNLEMSQQDVAYEFTSTVNGMRHEMAAETLLSAAGIDYDYRVSAEEDSNGNDLFIYIDGQWVGIDIKASFNAERRAYQRHPNSRALWTTLRDEDFRGPGDASWDSVSISYDAAERHAKNFKERIRAAIRGELSYEHRNPEHIRRRGRSVLTAHQHTY